MGQSCTSKVLMVTILKIPLLSDKMIKNIKDASSRVWFPEKIKERIPPLQKKGSFILRNLYILGNNNYHARQLSLHITILHNSHANTIKELHPCTRGKMDKHNPYYVSNG